MSRDTVELQNKLISLKISLAKAIEEREFIIKTIKPSIEADFQLKIGAFQLELLQLDVECRRLKAMVHRIQADVNHNKKPDLETIEIELQKEFKKWYKHIEREAEKVKDAKDRFDSQMTQTESSEFKKQFRELVKKLHLDINPDLGQNEKELWLQVIQSYNKGDLNELRALSVLMEDTSSPGESTSNIQELNDQLDTLQSHLTKINEDISVIKSAHPFDVEENLSNKKWVKEKQSEITDGIEKCKQMIITYVDIIENLLGFKVDTVLD